MQLLKQIQELNFPAPLPETLLKVRQTFNASQVEDLPGRVHEAWTESGVYHRMQPGATVGVGVGSRGIAHIPVLAKASVDWLREHGFRPFVFPAMGSHGGATAEGQKLMMAELGVTAQSVGCDIRATMEVKSIGEIENGPVLFQGVESMAADHCILISRIKPHTDFRGTLESGPSKMSVIGLGKQHGASVMHAGGGENFQKYLAPAARLYEAETNLIGALCPIENAYDQTARIEFLSDGEIGTAREAELLVEAKERMASLPFDAIDILVVKELGKNISGTGMDTNVASRLMIPRQPEDFGAVDVGLITVLDLTPETHGNVSGLGLANVTTARVAEKIDWVATYTNAITSGIFGMFRVHLPITMPADEQSLQVAIRGCAKPPEEARMVFIRNTLMVDEFYASPSLRKDIETHPRLSIDDELPLSFSHVGVMASPWQLK